MIGSASDLIFVEEIVLGAALMQLYVTIGVVHHNVIGIENRFSAQTRDVRTGIQTLKGCAESNIFD